MTHRSLCLALVALLSSSCSERSLDPEPPSEASALADPAAGPSARERAIHAYFTLAVSSTGSAVGEIRSALEDVGGYVASSSIGEDAASLELRVPADRLDDLRRRIASAADIVHESEEVEDVTRAHVDVEARLASAREEERRLLSLYADRTASLADVLAVERELSRVRGDAERLDAERRTIEARVAFARVDLELRLRSPALDDEPLAALREAAVTGLRMGLRTVLGAAAALLFVGPTLATLAALAAVFLRARRTWRRSGGVAA